jgi:hypothetical protein
MPTGNIDEELIILKKHFKGVEKSLKRFNKAC